MLCKIVCTARRRLSGSPPARPELVSGRPIGEYLGSGVQDDVYTYGSNEVMKLLKPCWRQTHWYLGGNWVDQLRRRLELQQRYIGRFMIPTRVECDTLIGG